MISFHLTEIAPEIQKGLLSRRKEYSGNPAATKWLYQKTPWARLMSNAIVAKGSQAKQYENLLNQLDALKPPSAFQPGYDIGSAPSQNKTGVPFSPIRQSNSPDSILSSMNGLFDQTAREKAMIGFTAGDDVIKTHYPNNLRPEPGITRISVSTQGSLGSLRMAKVYFNVWTTEDLEFLEPFYFIPGMSVLLEWGWSVNIDGNTVNPIPLSYPIKSDAEAREQIAKLRKQNKGDYDGLQGLVTNFSYDYNGQAGWDCVLELVSAADIFANAPIHSTATAKCRDEDSPTKEATSELFAAWLKSMILDPTTWIATNNLKNFKNPVLHTPENHVFRLSYHSTNRDPQVEDHKPWYKSAIEALEPGKLAQSTANEVSSLANTIFDSQIASPHTVETFITMDYFIALINACFTLKGFGGESHVVKIDISGVYDNQAKKRTPGVFIGTDPWLGSTDPFSCILYNKPDSIPFPVKNYLPKRQLKPYTGYLNDILLNCVMINEAYKNADDVKSFIRNVLESVSAACGNFFNFELQEPPEDQKAADKKAVTLTITNTHMTNANSEQAPEPFTFAFANKEILNLSVKSKLTDAMKAQALYGTNSNKARESTDKASNNERFYRLTGKGTSSSVIVKNGTLHEDVSVQSPIPACPPGQIESTDNPLDVLKNAYAELSFERTDETAAAAGTAMTTYFNEKGGESAEGALKNKNLILPLEITLNLDGVGGIVWGNVVGVSDMLPTRLASMFYYQTTVIEQEVSNGRWITTLNTIPRFKNG